MRDQGVDVRLEMLKLTLRSVRAAVDKFVPHRNKVTPALLNKATRLLAAVEEARRPNRPNRPNIQKVL